MMRKAQGALEFLMTYGWAFLVILIMIGALAYFGVLSPTRFLPERCSLGSQLGCEDYVVSQAGSTIDLKIRNNMGYTIQIPGITVDDPDNQFVGCVATTGDPGIDVDIVSGATQDVTITCTSIAVASGVKYKVYPQVSYFDVRSTATYTHIITGELFAEVQP